MHLLLFDIDGTLVRVNGTGRTAVMQALSSVTDRPISTDDVPFSGRTDPAIFEAVLKKNGVAQAEATVDEAIEAYVEAMQSALTPADVEVLPGVEALLSGLAERPDVHLGLVTGNVEPIAYKKLSVHGLDRHFSVGAFGSDHADRNRLPDLAAQRASQQIGQSFQSAEHAIVIGDTPHDIECARATGARSVAVCTGRYERNELSRQNPDLLLDRFPSADPFLQRVLNISSSIQSN